MILNHLGPKSVPVNLWLNYCVSNVFLLVWVVLSDEQRSKRWPFSLLNDEQMSNWVGVVRTFSLDTVSFLGTVSLEASRWHQFHPGPDVCPCGGTVAASKRRNAWSLDFTEDRPQVMSQQNSRFVTETLCK